MTAFGPFATIQNVRARSAIRGEADSFCSRGAYPVLTLRRRANPSHGRAANRVAADLIARLEPFLSLAQFRTQAMSAFALLSGALGQTRLPRVAALSFLRH
jgi:hypothetical protein